ALQLLPVHPGPQSPEEQHLIDHIHHAGVLARMADKDQWRVAIHPSHGPVLPSHHFSPPLARVYRFLDPRTMWQTTGRKSEDRAAENAENAERALPFWPRCGRGAVAAMNGWRTGMWHECRSGRPTLRTSAWGHVGLSASSGK